MDALHRAYVTVTEHWWLASLAVSCIIACLIALKPVPFSVAIAALVLGALLTIGWMILDVIFYPASHNLLPFEAVFKFVLLSPIAVAFWFKIRRRSAT
jgi:hypothetical protein